MSFVFDHVDALTHMYNVNYLKNMLNYLLTLSRLPRDMKINIRTGQYVGIYCTGARSLNYQDAISTKYHKTDHNKIANIAMFSVWNI